MPREVLSILVDNHSGVLTRVASLFGRRGFNIDSLTVSATDDPAISRITIVVHDDAKVLEQIIKQTARLEETREIFPLDTAHSLLRELLLVKVEAGEENRSAIREIANIYKAKIIDLSIGSMGMGVTGETGKIGGFLDVVFPYKIGRAAGRGRVEISGVAGSFKKKKEKRFCRTVLLNHINNYDAVTLHMVLGATNTP